MKIELVKKTEVEPHKGEMIWYVVKYGINQKHFTAEKDALSHLKAVKAHFEKHGTIQPVEEVLMSEEITPKIPVNETTS